MTGFEQGKMADGRTLVGVPSGSDGTGDSGDLRGGSEEHCCVVNVCVGLWWEEGQWHLDQGDLYIVMTSDLIGKQRIRSSG